MKRDCDACGRSYPAKSPRSKFCADAECKRRRERERTRLRRAGGATVLELPAPSPASGALTAAARAELEAAGVADTDAGQLVLLLAGRLDGSSGDTGSSFAALSREYRAARTEALKDAVPVASPVDELKKRAQERRLSIVS